MWEGKIHIYGISKILNNYHIYIYIYVYIYEMSSSYT